MGSFTIFRLLEWIGSASAWAHGISDADRTAMLDGGPLRFIGLGATHMLTGYDHLLFIFGVIFFLTNLKDIVKFITIFTIGHSITLVFATIFKVNVNYYLIDGVIALSVCYKGFENIDGFKKYLHIRAPNLMAIIFGFGLIHGFGLSTRLQQLPLGEEGLIGRILAFNLGVELGQITALAIMVLFISQWRKTESFKKFSNASNFGLIVAGAFLFLMQMHGYSHTSHPNEFGFPHDEHHHAHEKIDRARKQKEMEERLQQYYRRGHGHGHENGHQAGPGKSHPQGRQHTHEDGKPHSHGGQVHRHEAK